MTRLIIWIAWLAVTMGGILTVFDVITCIQGMQSIMGEGDGGWIATLMPFCIGTLAVCFNAASSYLFPLSMQGKFTAFTPTVTFFMWIGFIVFDLLSSLTGILATYANMRVNSLETVKQAFEKLGPIASFFSVIMALLLTFGPFLVFLFAELIGFGQEEEPQPQARR